MHKNAFLCLVKMKSNKTRCVYRPNFYILINGWSKKEIVLLDEFVVANLNN